jgi:ATP-dependent Lhr-like helicase
MDGFSLLSQRMRRGVADQLRWAGLRPVQEASIRSILAGENAVILAPTAGGKTEAAFLPALDVAQELSVDGVVILYVSPLVALLNNQEERVGQLADLVGLRAFKWHGGVSSSARKRFLSDPAEVLLTTPESLEAMLIGRRVPTHELFRALRFVIIDEIHAFASSDRGSHLISVLERLAALSEHDVQRIGLSATVRNPGDIGRWMKGRSSRLGRVIDPKWRSPQPRQATVVAFADKAVERGEHLDYLTAATGDAKTLVFTESRADAELLADHLSESPALDYVGTYHSAISSDARQSVEDTMNSAGATRACVTCTSAMELGIDIGDLDEVIQWGPPGNVSSLLQRWGRTGRRAGQTQSTRLLTYTSWDTLSAVALLTLAEEGWVEAVTPPSRAYHILFQQLINSVLQNLGADVDALWRSLAGIPAFRDITYQDYRHLLDHLIKEDILANPGGTLVLGDVGEKKLGGRHFQRLIVSFEMPDSYTVVDTRNNFEVGTLEVFFVEQLRAILTAQPDSPVIVLAGKAWQVQHIHDELGRVEVTPYRGGKPPQWQSGSLRITSRELAARHREILLTDSRYSFLNTTGQSQLAGLRSVWREHLAKPGIPYRLSTDGLELATFAGTKINATIEKLLGLWVKRTSSTAFTVTVGFHDGQAASEVMTILRDAAGGISAEQQRAMVENLKPLRLSKYQAFLPTEMATRVVADYLLDVPSTVSYLQSRV